MTTNQEKGASVAEAVEYIRSALINGKLNMKEATTELGWTFPRVRSRAKTICKKMKGTFEKESRGVYIFQPGDEATIIPVQSTVSPEKPLEGRTYTDAEIEKAILGIDTKE